MQVHTIPCFTWIRFKNMNIHNHKVNNMVAFHRVLCGKMSPDITMQLCQKHQVLKDFKMKLQLIQVKLLERLHSSLTFYHLMVVFRSQKQGAKKQRLPHQWTSANGHYWYSKGNTVYFTCCLCQRSPKWRNHWKSNTPCDTCTVCLQLYHVQ